MDDRLTVTKGDWTPEAMDDLKERLLKVEGSVEYSADPGGTVTCWHRNPDGPEALARIEALEQHVSELEEALRPFAEACDECVDDRDSDQCSIWEHGVAMQIEFRHLRFARAALNREPNP
jgi:hypothetical protein